MTIGTGENPKLRVADGPFVVVIGTRMARIDEDVTGEGINVVVIAVDVPAEAVPIYQRELSAGVIDAITAGVKS